MDNPEDRNPQGDDRTMGRRSFFGAAALAAGSAVAAAGGVVAAVYLAVPALGEDQQAAGWTVVRGLTAEPGAGPARVPVDVVHRSGWARTTSKQAVFIEKRTDGSVAAYSARCPHQGCLVDWRAEQGDYFCVCHASTWHADGAMASGPSKRGLDPLEARLTPEGDVEVKYVTFALDTAERVVVR